MLVVNHSIVVVCYSLLQCFLSGLIRTLLTRSHTGVDQTAGWLRNTVTGAENSYWQARPGSGSQCEDNWERFCWLPV